MAKVEYPAELTQAWWDKKKPVLAKTKKTGIGEKLKDLKKAHDGISWDNLMPYGSTLDIDKKLEDWPKTFAKDIKPLADKAKEIQKLAKKWSADFSKEKLIPKSASAAADSVAEAAKTYADDILDFEGAQAKDMVALRKQTVEGIKKMLKPMLTKTSAKIEGLLKDLGTYGRNPTKENFFTIFKKDCNARGYTTGCKNWDQLLIEFPEIRDQCYKGKAMTDFFPGMQDYGAEWDESEFAKRVNPKTGKTTEAEIYRQHAIIMLKQAPNIKKFKAAIDKALKLIEG